MLYVLKKIGNQPKVVPHEDEELFLQELVDVLDVDKNATLSLFKLTPDGLYAVGVLEESYKPTSRNINCMLYSFVPVPLPIKIMYAASNIAFFRFKYSNNLIDLIPEDEVENTPAGEPIELDTYDDNFSLAPIRRNDVLLIAKMLSVPFQKELIMMASSSRNISKSIFYFGCENNSELNKEDGQNEK